MELKNELSKRIYNQHKLGCKVALAVNIIWAIMNCVIVEQDWCMYSIANSTVALIILGTLIANRRKRISGELLGLIPMLSTLTAFAFIYNTLDLETFQKMSYANVAVYVGAGMFLLWNLQYSIISLVYALIVNVLAFVMFSPLTLEEYMLNGGFMIVTVGAFMVLSIEIRYELTKREIKMRIELEERSNQLKESEKQHRLLFEKNPTPMLICSLDNLKILAVNDLVIEKYGYTREEFTNMKITDLHKQIDYKDVILCAKESQCGDDSITEWTHVLKDKTEIDVELIAKSINYDGESARLVSINDITAVKQYQNELIKAKEEALRSKELQAQFLSNMSHEIRTPMNGVIGITRVLKNTKLNKEQQHYLNVIMKSSENLIMIINNILDFSKIEAGKLEIEETKFNLDELLNVVQEIMLVNAEEKGIYLRVVKKPEAPEWINGDPVRLNQILTNLISNAIKFTEKGGVTVVVSSEMTKEGKVNILFDVKDTGIGIAADKQSKIFKSFTQANSSTTRTHGGTGLGLTITRQLIELQDGTIQVDSEVGKGSTFHFEIAYNVAEEQIEMDGEALRSATTRQTLESLGGLNILLVEDHPINQMLAKKVLGDWGFNVTLAENGKEALAKIGQADFHLVLMDISMPEMDGYEATREIRTGKYNDNPEIPIIAMTASAFIGENQKCFKNGMNDYVSKPFEPDFLLEKIAKHTLGTNKKSA